MKEENIVERFTEELMYRHMERLEHKVKLALKPKPTYMPRFLYNFLLKELFEIQHFK